MSKKRRALAINESAYGLTIYLGAATPTCVQRCALAINFPLHAAARKWSTTSMR